MRLIRRQKKNRIYRTHKRKKQIAHSAHSILTWSQNPWSVHFLRKRVKRIERLKIFEEQQFPITHSDLTALAHHPNSPFYKTVEIK